MPAPSVGSSDTLAVHPGLPLHLEQRHRLHPPTSALGTAAPVHPSSPAVGNGGRVAGQVRRWKDLQAERGRTP